MSEENKSQLKKKDLKKGNKKVGSKKTTVITKKKKKLAAKAKEEEDDLQSESNSSSAESDEDEGYEPYPETKYIYYTTSKKPNRLKTLESKFESIFGDKKKRNGKKKSDFDDEDFSDDFQDDLEKLTEDDEDRKYFIERNKMEKLMSTNDPYSEENWWTRFDPDPLEALAAYPYPYIPPGSSYAAYDPLSTDNLSVDTESGGLTKWVSNMLGSFMPSFSWGGNDAFKNDPFFAGAARSGVENNGAGSFSSDSGTKLLPTLSALNTSRSQGRSGKGINLEDLFGVQLNSKQMDYTTVCPIDH